MSTYDIGRKGEELIAEILPGAIDINKNKGMALPYDVLWNDLRIDVKTTLQTDNQTATFSIKPGQINTGILLVMVAITDERNYYWVAQYKDKIKSRYKFADSIEESELLEAIIDVATKPFELVTRSKPGYKFLSIKRDDYHELEATRELWAKEHGIILTMPQFIMFLLDSYKKVKL